MSNTKLIHNIRNTGPIGLTLNGIQKTPLRMFSEVKATKISSGSDHLVALSLDGQIYTLGNSEQVDR